MNDIDLEHRLIDMGVPQDVARGLQSKMDGRDLMALTNALNSQNINDDVTNANTILRKYGVHIQGANNMSEKFEYLSALMAKARSSAGMAPVSESDRVEWLTPIEESDDLIASSLAREGFNYVTSVDNRMLGEKLIDWLDENQVDYLTNGNGQFQIKCPDRDGAYRVSGAISRIMTSGRNSLRDSAVEETTTVAEKTIKGQNTVVGRNPIAIAMAKRGGGGGHTSKDPARKDPLDRKAKHKGRADEDSSFAIGESVAVAGRVGEVKIPHGPNGTIGVLFDGELTMVSESEVALNEGIVGVTQVNPILRLRELAGLPPAPLSNPTPPATPAPEVAALPAISAPPMDAPVDLSVPDDDMGADLDMGPEVSDDFSDPAGTDASMDLGSSMGDDMSMGAEMGGVPGDLPPGGAEMPMGVPVMPTQSDAFSQIEDALNNIQTQLGDVKLSEYKSIVKKLEDLAGQVRVMGRDYLGERRLRS